ncbi:hypothetical protein BDV96DRAFT_505469 [Lophiotrema nucula]|uniref:Uncharacterized protein n=1 Tax=Lophiotrema nucula TaxID=690887 RepID=A0A6A5YLB3_9PLEO|nr:hypothetical protein BDV96DRAFT_505469 [Lophiotrema nucula]
MAEGNEGPPLDLEQILKTLASLAPPPNTALQDQQQPYAQTIPGSVLSADASRSHSSTPVGEPYNPAHAPDPRLSNRSISQQRPQHLKAQGRAYVPTFDHSGITEWKHGLRAVNKVASQNPAFEGAIHKLIKDQERNVRDWNLGRQRLIKEQAAKRENEQDTRAAISLPGLLDSTGPLRTPERDQEELEQFHQKVYRASQRMVDAQAAELQRLSVPFFGVDPTLILPDGDESKKMDDENASKMVTKRQILGLQRQMLKHLMDLYGD